MKKLLITLLFVLLLFNAFSQNNNVPQENHLNNIFKELGETYFKFKIQTKKDIPYLSKIISIDNIKDNYIYAYANKKEFTEFLKLNYKYTILPHPRIKGDVNMLNWEEIQKRKDWDYYPTYEAYESMMYQFEADHPDICKIYTIATLQSGRKILVARISDNVNQSEDEPEFFYTGQMHGDEIVCYILFLHLIDYLTTNYGNIPKVTNLVNNIEIWINPLANPDGTYHGGNNTVNGAIRYNANYVDLNRNFPDPEDGPHPDGNEWQPETEAFMSFANAHNFVMSANTHSGAELVNYPWDTWSKLHADNDWWYYVSRQYADTVHAYSPSGYFTGQNNGVTNGYQWYTINGGRQDYMNYFQHCREFTVEQSNVKMLNANQLQQHWEYNYRSFLDYLQESLYGIRGIITDSITGQPLRAKVFVLQHDVDSSFVYSSLPVGNYHRPISQGIYSLKFSAPGYFDRIINNVSVSNKEITVLNIKMESSELIADFSADKTLIKPGESINFTDNSYGDPISWLWSFEGGTPETSSIQNPLDIVYNDTGSFSVSLTVYNENGLNNTITKNNYISVKNWYNMSNSIENCCSGTFYDSGGENSNYSDYEDYTMTFYPKDENKKLVFDFIDFNVEYQSNCNYDFLNIYDGINTSSVLIGKYCGTNSPGIVKATNSFGALTFVFHSDGAENKTGWKANISCDTGVGINNFSDDNNISIFPNPISENQSLIIKSDILINEVSVFNVFGEKIFSDNFSDNNLKINLKNIKTGIYFIKIKTSKGYSLKKLVVF